MPHSDPSLAEKTPENHPFCAHFRAFGFGQIALGQAAYGPRPARRGWMEKTGVLNTYPPEKLLASLRPLPK